MDCPKLTAPELRRRYRQGERQFEGVDLSGESLRGMNLTGINFSSATLNDTDLRSTNFTNATLIGACMYEAKTGMGFPWFISKLVMALALMILSSILSTFFWMHFAAQIVDPGGADALTDTVTGNIVGGGIGLICLFGLLGLIYSRGILKTVRIVLIAIAVAFAIAVVSAIASDIAIDIGIAVVFSVVFDIAIAGSIAAVVASAGAAAGVAAIVIVSAVAVALAVAMMIFVAFVGAIAAAFSIPDLSAVPFAIAGAITLMGTVSTLIMGYLASDKALKGEPSGRLLRNVAVWFAAVGATQFKGADLTDADFSNAILKNARLHDATIVRTRFHLVRHLNLARLGRSILADAEVQNLLITLRGQGKSYIGKNLKGANLAGADVAAANFTNANLSHATFERADLQRVNFTKTQVLDTQFSQADLTGACLEGWTINSMTRLDGAICEHVYLLNNQQERRPNSGSFQPGEFIKLLGLL